MTEEEEIKRRGGFQKMLRRKQIIHASIICGAVAVLLLVLALCGVFDRVDPPAYKTYYIASGVSFQGEKPESTVPKGVDFAIPSMAVMPYADEDRRDTTIYNALTEYCSKNDYAVGEYRINYRDYVLIDDDIYLSCGVLAECMDYRKKAGNQTWKDLGYAGVSMGRVSGSLYLYQTEQVDGQGELPEDVQNSIASEPLITINENMPINTYLTYMTIYIKI